MVSWGIRRGIKPCCSAVDFRELKVSSLLTWIKTIARSAAAGVQ